MQEMADHLADYHVDTCRTHMLYHWSIRQQKEPAINTKLDFEWRLRKDYERAL